MSQRAIWAAGIVLAVTSYAATGVTALQLDEVGIVRRFGAVRHEPWEPGLHWGLPWGMDQVDRIKVNQTRTIAVGATGQTAAPLLRAPDPISDDFLTGDLNLVTAEALVQYRVRDPAAYLFRTTSVEETLAAIAEWEMTRALANRGIDELLTTGRAEVALGLTHAIQAMADRDGLGISIVAIRLGRVVPPTAVAPAFADAARARGDRRQAITRAEEYRDRTRSEARGQSREIGDLAAGRFDRLVQPARGEAARFTQVLAEARKDAGAFRQRLLLETLAELLPRFRRTVVVPPGQDLDITLFGDEAPARAKEPSP
jgi:modulator of FtsH protease HflK